MAPLVLQEVERRKDKSINQISSIYDKLYDVNHTLTPSGEHHFEHRIYKTKEGKPWKFNTLLKFTKWIENRIENRRKHLLEVLTPHQYFITQKKGTERAFTGEYWWYNDVGMYSCLVCTQRLFLYEHKYKNKSGFPTFWTSLKDSVRFENDNLDMPEVTNAL